jgi:hypothetical protein
MWPRAHWFGMGAKHRKLIKQRCIKGWSSNVFVEKKTPSAWQRECLRLLHKDGGRTRLIGMDFSEVLGNL